MPEQNDRNLLYFESSSMRDLYDSMETWQNTNHTRLLSISLQKDGGKFCCIALTNPSEVVIVGGGWKEHQALVTRDGRLAVKGG